MKQVSVHPSLLAADFSNLRGAVESLKGSGSGGVHCDIMDGHFVPNITFGPLVVNAIKPLTDIPLFCHLMIEQPELYVEKFVEAGACEITVHAEACVHLHRVLQQIKATGVRAGVALNPSTPLCFIENVITDMDLLLIMTVNPGFGGQSFIPTMLPKITEARGMADKANPALDIAVDGGIDVVTAPDVVRAGANVLIAGTAVFGNSSPAAASEAIRAAGEAGRGSREI